MAFRQVDTSWIARLEAKRLARPVRPSRCKVCGEPIELREGDDAVCDACVQPSSMKTLCHIASIDRRPAVFEAGEVPTRYRVPFEDLAVWPVDASKPIDLRAWPEEDEMGKVALGQPWALTIRGDFETGKTQLAVELAARIALRRREPMLFVSAANVAAAVFDEDPREYTRICRMPILVVDDLGRSYSGNQGQAVQRLICDRYNWLRTTIFTTNAEEDAFDDPSVVVRLAEGLQVEMTRANQGR